MDRGLIAIALASATLLQTHTTGEAATPEKRHLVYAIMRNGTQIGQHEVDVTTNGKTTTVDFRTKIDVKVMFINAYSFAYTAREVWSDNAFASFRSQTDDNGTKHTVTATAVADKTAIVADGRRTDAVKGILPTSFWTTNFAGKSDFFNTETGQQLKVEIRDLGMEQLPTKAGTRPARHLRLSGGLERELWFDASGAPVRFQLKGSDGSTITSEAMQ